MKIFSKILTLAAISAATTTALANIDNHPISNVKEGFLVGVDFGYGYLSTPEESWCRLCKIKNYSKC